MGHAVLMPAPSETRCALNPSVMHALYIIEDCKGNIDEALKLAGYQMQSCNLKEFEHWLRVHEVIEGKMGGKA